MKVDTFIFQHGSEEEIALCFPWIDSSVVLNLRDKILETLGQKVIDEIEISQSDNKIDFKSNQARMLVYNAFDGIGILSLVYKWGVRIIIDEDKFRGRK